MKLYTVPKSPTWLKSDKEDPKEQTNFFVCKFRKGLPRLAQRIRDPHSVDSQMSKTRAIALGEDIIAEWLKGGRIRPSDDVFISEAIDKLIPVLEAKHASGKRRARTWRKDRYYLRLMREWFGNYRAKEIDEDFWESWHDTVGARMNRTHGDTAKYLSLILNFCARQKWVTRKPQFKNLEPDEKKGMIYTPEQVQEVFKHANQRLKDQMTLGYECGMRSFEVRELRWEFVREDGGRIMIDLPDWFSKSHARAFFVSDAVESVLRRLIHVSGGTPFVFPSIAKEGQPDSDGMFNRRWRRARKKAGLPEGARFYDLRHSFLNHMVYVKGESLQAVADYAGNSPDTLRKHYLQNRAMNTRGLANQLKVDCKPNANQSESDEANLAKAKEN